MDATRIAYRLGYPAAGETSDGPVFRAAVMEDKWDVSLHEGHLYFARSWTGELVYRAKVDYREDGTRITEIDARAESPGSDPACSVAAVDYLMLSHVYGLESPHPLPTSIGRDPRELALFSFSRYGRRGRRGTFADTTGLPVLAGGGGTEPFPRA